MIRAGTLDDLISRLHYQLTKEQKPIAFVVGSGLTQDSIPGVKQIVRSMRSSLEDPDAAARFDEQVVSDAPGEQYQQAADFIIHNRGQHLLDRIIRLAVLSACTSIKPTDVRAILDKERALLELEKNADWKLDLGVLRFGRLLASMPSDIRGPVITTNFDPLVEVAVRRAGGEPLTRFIGTDGRVISGDTGGAVDVVHVHGFWRSGETLHTIHQLTQPRPELRGSLRRMLSGHLVVVMGYSGWEDAFTLSLLERATERDYYGMEVIWCSFARLTDSDFQEGLWAELARSNASTFYQEIDVNVAMPRLFEQYRGSVPDGRTPVAGALRGWTVIDEAFLELRSGATTDTRRRLSFFDGAQPDWTTALDSGVPRLSHCKTLYESFEDCLDNDSKEIIVAGVGPMGEGKSIALRQATVDLVRKYPEVTFYWREPGAPLDVNDVWSIPRVDDRKIALVTDDGDLLVDQLKMLAERCRDEARDDIRVLAVAQERDWRNVGAATRLNLFALNKPTVGMTIDDAKALVDAWEGLGALGELVALPGEERADRLYDLAADKSSPAGKSLVGAMLKVRFGPKLVDRVGDLLDRLDRSSVGDVCTLSDVFLMIALLHVAFSRNNDRNDASPLTLRVLARALDSDEDAVEYQALDPLGKEAAITRHGGETWIRHVSIAEAAVVRSRERDPAEIPKLIEPLVSAAVGMSTPDGPMDKDLYSVAYLSQYLSAGDEAVLAAKTAVEAGPTRLSYRTSLVSALRKNNQIEEAVGAATKTWQEWATLADMDSAPGFLTEWATTCGQADMPTLNTLLDGLALMMLPADSNRARDQTLRALLGMGVGLKALHDQTRDARYGEALAGIVQIASSHHLSGRHRQFARIHDDYCRRNSIYISDDQLAWPAVQSALDALQESAPEPLTAHLRTHRIVVDAGRTALNSSVRQV